MFAKSRKLLMGANDPSCLPQAVLLTPASARMGWNHKMAARKRKHKAAGAAKLSSQLQAVGKTFQTLHGDGWPADTLKRSYFTDYVCGDGTNSLRGGSAVHEEDTNVACEDRTPVQSLSCVRRPPPR